jgi:pimeloyl-ACP methyl ester carboxylesterase
MSIYHQESGQGFPIVLLHGFCETHWIWESFRKNLSDQFRVLTPDLPGFGQSEKLPDGFSLQEVADALHDYLLEQQVEKCVMVGHSLGGYVVLEMLRKYPEFLAGFVLFNSSAFADGDEKKENRNKLIDFIDTQGVAPFIKTFVPSLFVESRQDEFQPVIARIQSEGEKIDPEAVKGYAAAMRDRPDGMDLLKQYREKAMVIAGEEDQNVPLKKSKAMADVLPDDQVVMLPDTAHMGMFEQLEVSQKAVRNFSARVSG